MRYHYQYFPEMVLPLSEYCPLPLGTKAMDDPPQEPPPPPPDAPHVEDPAGPLVIGEFVIKGVDEVTPKMRKHVIMFYNQVITMMNAAGPSWQLMRKERYDRIKGVLVRICNGDEVKHIRQAHPQCYKWCLAYVLVNDGEGGFLLVICPKNVIGFEALSKDADIDTSTVSAISRELMLTSNTITARTNVRVIPCLAYKQEGQQHWSKLHQALHADLPHLHPTQSL